MAPGRPRRNLVAPHPVAMQSNPPISPSLPDAVGSSESPVIDTTSTSTATRKGRGKTRGLALLKMIRAKGKIKVNIPEGKNRAIGPGSQFFTTEIGVLSRQYLPIQVSSYSAFKDEDKDACYRHILDKFDIDITKPHVKNTCEFYLRDHFNKHRHRLHKEFQTYPSSEVACQHPPKDICQDDWDYLCTHFSSGDYQKKSKINKENRAKLKVSHIMGTKSFVRARYDERNRETGEEPDRIAFWKMTHHSNEKGWCDPTAEAIYGEMIELKATSEMEGTMMTVDEICDQVLGTRPGYIRGLGHGPKPTSGRRSNLEAIEEAKKRAEMAEKRAEELAERLESQHLEKDAQMDAMTTRQSHLETMLQSILEQMQSLGHRPTFP